MKNLIEFLLNRLVTYPDEVRVEEVETEGDFTYIIHVNPEDIGRVIGKNGSVINAIRTICKVRAVKEHIHARVELAQE